MYVLVPLISRISIAGPLSIDRQLYQYHWLVILVPLVGCISTYMYHWIVILMPLVGCISTIGRSYQYHWLVILVPLHVDHTAGV